MDHGQGRLARDMNVILNAFSTYIEEHFSNFVAKAVTVET